MRKPFYCQTIENEQRFCFHRSAVSAQGWNRTADIRIFSPPLYQLSYRGIYKKLRGKDLNLRPPGYEPDELPDCSTPRYYKNGWWWIRTTEGVASRFTVCPLWPLGKPPIYEADDRTRTDNLLLTNQLLCQLSHIGILYSPFIIERPRSDSNRRPPP